eukprot:218186_1
MSALDSANTDEQMANAIQQQDRVAGSISDESSKVITKKMIEKALEYHQSITEAYSAYALIDTLIFAFGIQLFSGYGDLEWESDTMGSVYSIVLALSCAFSSFSMVILSVYYYMIKACIDDTKGTGKFILALADVETFTETHVGFALSFTWMSVCFLMTSIVLQQVNDQDPVIAIIVAVILLSPMLYCVYLSASWNGKYQKSKKEHGMREGWGQGWVVGDD